MDELLSIRLGCIINDAQVEGYPVSSLRYRGPDGTDYTITAHRPSRPRVEPDKFVSKQTFERFASVRPHAERL